MKIKAFLVTSALYLSLAGGAASVMADEDRRHERDAEGRVTSVGDDGLRFTLAERTQLQDYLAGNDADRGRGVPKALPHGLQKKVDAGKMLPPGWQRKFARGDVLPGQVYAAVKPLPVTLASRLPAGPEGTVTFEVDGEIVRVLQDTLAIVDILRADD